MAVAPSVELVDGLVSGLVVENPSRARVFERHGIDYCCHGNRPLSEACAERGLNPSEILRELEAVDAQSSAVAEIDWRAASLADLTRHIENTHHHYLREELPRLGALLDKVVQAHGNDRPEIATVVGIFQELVQELVPHMLKEEHVLFPAIRELERTRHRWGGCGGTVRNPIGAMESEHEHAGDALRRLRAITRDYQPPEGACPTYLALYEGFAALESDMHRHVHKENYILFPRALELEARLPG